MIVIEDKNIITFSHKGKDMSIKDGFEYLDNLYKSEPIEVRKVIDGLKEKYIERN